LVGKANNKANGVKNLGNPNANYPSTLANSTLIILFSEILKFKKIISSKSKTIVKDNSEIIRSIPFVETNFSKLINYLTDMC
jgi:hypothetical protein